MIPNLTQKMEGMSTFIREMLSAWNTPGAAIAIVKDGDIIFAEGAGLRNVEKNLGTSTETIFGIGSCTKAFTATAIAILVDEGKLDWDSPVRNYLPSFRMQDSFTSERITPRDLLCHRSGLPQHPFMYLYSPRARREIVRRLQYLEPAGDFRSTFLYQNLSYIAAGYLAGHVSGSDWETCVQKRILDPLGMKSTSFSQAVARTSADHAIAYGFADDRFTGLPARNIEAAGPAGSINSNAMNMAQWLILNLAKGKHGKKVVVSEKNLGEILSPQMAVSEKIKYKELLYPHYGLGWFIQPYRGFLLVHHGGSAGYSSLVSFMPAENIGVVALANAVSPIPEILTYQVYDRLLGLDPVQWSERFQKEREEKLNQAKAKRAWLLEHRHPDTAPSHPLSDYAGEFDNPGYGVCSIALEGETLSGTLNGFSFTLIHYHYDIFELRSELVDSTILVSFYSDAQGRISRLCAPLEPSVSNIVFARVEK